MKAKTFKIIMYINVFIILSLVVFKFYSIFSNVNFKANNAKNIDSIQTLEPKDSYSFAVVGNINNSMDVFKNKIIQSVNNDKEIDFMISTGNAVMDGGEAKYQLFNKSIKKLKKPILLTFGQNELSDGGADRFYKHYGRFSYSFEFNNAYFIFLDTTNHTDKEIEKDFLITELQKSQNDKYRFVFMNKPPIVVTNKQLLNYDPSYIVDKSYRDFLTKTFSQYHVTTVFSSNAEMYQKTTINGVSYVVSGGAGGELEVNNSNSYYHYVKVNVNQNTISFDTVKVTSPNPSFILKMTQNIYSYFHAIFYLNLVNFILIIGILSLIAFLLYHKINTEVDYYRNYSNDQSFKIKDKLNIAMFTNNYLPFIGGVPISIYRLAKGLTNRGHQVTIFAPMYPNPEIEDEENIVRCKLLLHNKRKNKGFVIANIFSPEIKKAFIIKKIDIIHVHHPFWMGKKGLKLGKKFHIPVVLTYHTRLEKYAHFLPMFKKIFKNIIAHRLIKHFSQNCNAIIAPTTSAKDYLSNIGVSRNKYVLPTGIDFSNYENVSITSINIIKEIYQNKVILLTVSRLSKEKNIHFLLEGIKRLKRITDLPFVCLIIGDGPEKKMIEEFITEHQLQSVIELIGLIKPKEITRYYLASDIFIFSSQSETQGMVLLEAMAGQCPVVAVNSSGIDDIIINNYNGFKTKLNINEWTKKIKYLLENKENLTKLSKNAYQFSKKYSVTEMANRVEVIYKEVLEKYIKDNK